MIKHCKLSPSVAGLLTVVVCSQMQSHVEAKSIAKEKLPPVTVQEASSKEFNADRDRLNVLAQKEDLNSLLSAADQTSKKWLITDKLSYYCILSAVCSDLTSYDYGLTNLSKQHAAAERYAMDALTNDDSLALGMRAFFVEHLTYAPGHELSGPTGPEWSRLREQRLGIWLKTWQQIRQRTVDNFSFNFEEPPLPPRKFISQSIIIDNYVDPKTITDEGERKKWITAWENYSDNYRLAQEQQDLHRVAGTFLPLATENIIADYSSAPYNTSELTQALNTSSLAPDVRAEILTAVKENIQHNTASGK